MQLYSFQSWTFDKEVAQGQAFTGITTRRNLNDPPCPTDIGGNFAFESEVVYEGPVAGIITQKGLAE